MARGRNRALGLIGLAVLATTIPSARALEDVHVESSPGVQVDTLVRSDRSWNGSPLPSYPSGQPVVTMLRIRVPAGVSLPRHHHPVVTAGVLLQGRLKVVMENGQSKVLKAGEALIEVVNQIHHGESLGPEPAVIVIMFAGVQGLPTTVQNEAPGPAL